MLRRVNLFLIIVPVCLFILSFITLLSTTPALVKNQLVFFILGSIAYLFFTLLNSNYIKYYWKYIYGASVLLLIITYVVGVTIFGSARWLNLGLFTFQPSEFAKLATIILFSAFVYFKCKAGFTLKKGAVLAILIFTLSTLVFIQPDLGTTLVILFSFFVMLFSSNFSKYYLLIGIIFLGIFSAPLWHSLAYYQKDRVLVFLNPRSDDLGSGYNVIQSIVAVGSGQALGKGFGQGTQAKLNFLPVHWTDFIFASYSEEWGFVGSVILLILYIILLVSLILTLVRANDPYSYYFILGVFSIFFFQFLINIGMNIGLLPVTGIPLPLFSYGGTSIIVSMSMLGMVQSILLY